MSAQDLDNLERLIRAVDKGSDRMRELMLRFEGYEREEPDENGERVWVPGVKALYTEAVADAANDIFEQYENEDKRPPGEDIRTARAVRRVKRENPKLYAEYHALAGSIAEGQRWLSNKKATLNGMQSLSRTGATLAGAR